MSHSKYLPVDTA